MSSAEIFDIFRGTTHDGPGLRTTVFFRGCPLRCRWCHNPEGIAMTPPVWWDDRRCIGCASCEKACPHGGIHLTGNGVILDSEKCTACCLCADACPTKALERISRPYSLGEVMREIEKYADYYTQFGGGVTASGGEAMMQSDFVAELFRELKEKKIHTALDTCGEVAYKELQKVLPYTDCILYDLKLMDSEQHKRLTGVHNGQILQNLNAAARDISEGKYRCDIWIRTPLIPNCTAAKENIVSIARFIKPYFGKQISRWEMCAFNNACTVKYRKLRADWTLKDEPILSQEEAEALRQSALAEGLDEKRVILTGILK